MPATTATTDGPASPASLRALLRRPAAMMVVALVLRLAAMTLGHTYRANPNDDHFGFGWETGRIARAIAEGDGFSSPFHGRTGPTAWVAPIYPYVVAGVFKVFGVFTYSSAWVLLALNSLFSALTCWSVYAIARETVGLRIARWAGWTWALLPYSMYWAIRWVWETSFSALLLSLAFLVALRVAKSARLRDWALFGGVWGVIALANPSILSVMPFMLAWACYQLYRDEKRWFAPVVTAILVMLLCVAPWMVRNYRAFGQVVFIRSNFGAELRMGNSMSANGLWMDWLHPAHNDQEMAKYQQMGELNYVHQRQSEALEFISEHPGRFAWLVFRRAAFFWSDTPRAWRHDILFVFSRNGLFLLSSVLAFWGLWLMVRDRRRGAFLYAALMLVYPMVYYITFPHPRYRHPIEPEMLILGLYVLARAMPEKGAVPNKSSEQFPGDE
jgi:4-amino-4-deoxy-L-arabinose transferase-like glycosyltransferase